MPYPEDELHASEELILDLHPHWWFFAKSAALLALAVILAIATLSVSWPSAVQNEIYQQMEANQIKAAERISGGINRAQSAPDGASIPDQIAKLSALRDQGVLTEDEFQAKKQELLGRM